MSIASTGLKDFWRTAMESSSTSPPPAPAPENLPLPILRRSERLAAVGNFLTSEEEKNFQADDPFGKPIGISPPKTLREAKLSPWCHHYMEAAKKEIDGLLQSKTWELVPRASIPAGTNILRGKFVFDDKRGENGRILKFKARYVAMGFTQKANIDYQETFAGVMVAKSFRIMLSILNEDPTHEMAHIPVLHLVSGILV